MPYTSRRLSSSAYSRASFQLRYKRVYTPRQAAVVKITPRPLMPFIARLAYWQGVILLGGFFGIVLWKLFTGRIGLRGLLHGDEADGGTVNTAFSPGRGEGLLVMFASAPYFLG